MVIVLLIFIGLFIWAVRYIFYIIDNYDYGLGPSYNQTNKQYKRPDYVTSQYNWEKPAVVKEVIPPRATFFGRINGKEFNKEGPLEPEYLKYYELTRWEMKNKPIEKDPNAIINEKTIL